MRELAQTDVEARIEAAYREGWRVNAIPADEHEAGPDYVKACENVDWERSEAKRLALASAAPEADAPTRDGGDCFECDGSGRIWNNADPTSGQWSECAACTAEAA